MSRADHWDLLKQDLRYTARTLRRTLGFALLAGVNPADIPTFASALGLTLIMAIAGALRPTMRAVRVDPIIAIRTE